MLVVSTKLTNKHLWHKHGGDDRPNVVVVLNWRTYRCTQGMLRVTTILAFIVCCGSTYSSLSWLIAHWWCHDMLQSMHGVVRLAFGCRPVVPIFHCLADSLLPNASPCIHRGSFSDSDCLIDPVLPPCKHRLRKFEHSSQFLLAFGLTETRISAPT